MHIPFGADLAVTSADIAFSNSHPEPGETISITATVRNLAFRDVSPGSDFLVRFLLDNPAEPANQIGQAPVSGALGYNETQAVTIPWRAPGGRHEIIVVADAEGRVEELDETNNRAARAIGEIARPSHVVATADPAGGRVLLNWEAPPTAGVVGYRVYRSLTSGGGYSPEGLCLQNSYADDRVVNGVTYYYVITALDAFGVESPHSEEVAATPQRTIVYRRYLPWMLKDRSTMCLSLKCAPPN